jgi:hypothetical protein
MVPVLKALDEYRDGVNLVFILIGWEEVIESYWKFYGNKIIGLSSSWVCFSSYDYMGIKP